MGTVSSMLHIAGGPALVTALLVVTPAVAAPGIAATVDRCITTVRQSPTHNPANNYRWFDPFYSSTIRGVCSKFREDEPEPRVGAGLHRTP